jgi:hypothetical protein
MRTPAGYPSGWVYRPGIGCPTRGAGETAERKGCAWPFYPGGGYAGYPLADTPANCG